LLEQVNLGEDGLALSAVRARVKKLKHQVEVLKGVPIPAAYIREKVQDYMQGLTRMAWKVPTLARVANNWSMNTDTMGVYGNYYLKRAIIAQFGLGANLPEDAIYPANVGDESGKPLDGASKYIMRFTKDALPPVDAFWSIILYDNEGFQVANLLNRFAVSSWMPFKRDADGSLTLYFQNENPGSANNQAEIEQAGWRRDLTRSILALLFLDEDIL
jgi:hypothetical protein